MIFGFPNQKFIINNKGTHLLKVGAFSTQTNTSKKYTNASLLVTWFFLPHAFKIKQYRFCCGLYSFPGTFPVLSTYTFPIG